MPKYSVTTFRSAGFEARWGRLRTGAPAMFVRPPGTTIWWVVDKTMWDMIVGGKPVLEAYDSCTALGHIFSIPA